MTTVITGARVFDGERILGNLPVTINGPQVTAVGGPIPPDADIIDAPGATLLPGLIDAHTHSTDATLLRQALVFGVTTELDLGSFPNRMTPLRHEAAARDDIADVRSSSSPMTAPGGHPAQLLGPLNVHMPTVGGVGDVPGFVADRIAEGADYLKVIIEDGTVMEDHTLPVLSPQTAADAVVEGHRHGKIVLVHAMTREAARQAVDAGADGLTHIFIDAPHTPEIIAAIAGSGMFVIPTLSIMGSLTGLTGANLAQDHRVRSRLSPEWEENLSGSHCVHPDGNLAAAVATVAALHRAGVDILAGTDSAHLGIRGVAHGVSLHSELRLLVRAGLTPVQALRAATALPAQRFGLTDRGRITQGARADLLLVDGDPTVNIADTLSIREIWRNGVRVDRVITAETDERTIDRRYRGREHRPWNSAV